MRRPSRVVLGVVLRSAGALALVAAGSLLLPAASEAGPGCTHPYFNDQGTLSWSTSLDEAVTAARASDRLIFIEYGRRECGNCRTLVQTILPANGVRNRVAAACVGLAADCDEPDPRVEAIFSRGLRNARMLPFVGIVTTDLQWITGWAGSIGADEILLHLSTAESARACRRPAIAARTAPTTTMPTPTPAPAAPKPVATAPAPAKTVPPAPPAPPVPVAPTAPALASRPTPTPTPTPAAPVAAAPAAAPAPAAIPSATTSSGPIVPTVETRPASATNDLGGFPAAPSAILSAAAALETAKHKAQDLLSRAKTADEAGAHAAVLVLDREASKVVVRSSPDTWRTLVERANTWCEKCLADALAAARDHRRDQASGLLAGVRHDAAGLPVATDAETGERAVHAVAAMDALTPADRASAMAKAREEFKGTRWAAIFAD